MNTKIFLLFLVSSLGWGSITAQTTNKDSAAIYIRHAHILHDSVMKLYAQGLKDSANKLNKQVIDLIYKAVGKLNKPQ